MKTYCVRAACLLAGVLSLASSAAEAQTFGYLGPIGPKFWGDLNPAWAACEAGSIQSPVDLGQLRRIPHLDITYGASNGEIFNNGHTIEIETQGANTLVLDDVTYELVQFHFHTASEHRMLGRGFDMELHLVHQAPDGSNAVVGVLLTRGASSGALAPIFASLPDDENIKHPLAEAFDPSAFLPTNRSHVRYVGSLTTPPCTEGVRWVVMNEPVTVSDEDVAQFTQRIAFNARLVQRRVGAGPTR